MVINRWKAVGVGSYWLTLTLQIMLLIIISPDPECIGVSICRNTYILVEIRLDELGGFYAGLEGDVIEFREFCACVHRLEQPPQSYWSHINHQGKYFPIYHDEGYD